MIGLLLLTLSKQVFLHLVCKLFILFLFVLEFMSVLGLLARQLDHTFVQIIPLRNHSMLLLSAKLQLVLV